MDATPKLTNVICTDSQDLELAIAKKKAAERDILNMVRYVEAEQRNQWKLVKSRNATFDAHVVPPLPEEMAFAQKVLRDPAVCNRLPDSSTSKGSTSIPTLTDQSSHEDSSMQLDGSSPHDSKPQA
jgi:hypothetical protein